MYLFYLAFMKVEGLCIYMSVLFSDELHGKPKSKTSHDQLSTTSFELSNHFAHGINVSLLTTILDSTMALATDHFCFCMVLH